MIVTYIWNLVSIKLYWLHILVKFRASIANIKRTMVLKNLTLEIKANLNNLAWLSQLEVCNVCQYVCNARNVRNVHIYENKTLRDVPGLTRPKFVRWKNGYFGGRGNHESTMLPIVNNLQVVTYLWTCFQISTTRGSCRPNLGLLLNTRESRPNITAFWHISALISCLDVCNVCHCISNAQTHTNTHILKLKHWVMFLALHSKHLLDEKNGYIGWG